jgi:hypothetical protein
MRRYHFDLVNTDHVTDAGGALLDDDDQAMKVAHNLAQGVRETRPELIGRGYRIAVRAEDGNEVCRVAVDPDKGDGG